VTRDPSAGVRYRPDSRHGHVESYFIKANDPNGRRALWLKATIYAGERDPSRAVAEAWAIAFDRQEGHVAVKTGVPFVAARFSEDEFDVAIDGCTFSERNTRGRVVTGDRSIGWELRLSCIGGRLRHFPLPWMYEASFPSSKLVSLAPDGWAEGEARVNGRTWDVTGWPATIGHNWGRRHAARYAWGHCNVWEDDRGAADQRPGAREDLVFEGVSAQIAVGPVLSPASALLFVRYRAKELGHRQVFGIGRYDEEKTFRRWRFRSRRAGSSIEGELWAETDDFVGLYYPNPDGTMTYCLNTKLARAELAVKTPWGPERTFRSKAAALEIATLDPNHGVRMYV
jgi:hypothetical protein